MNDILSGLDGVVCLMDDILIFGKDEAQHDARLEKVLEGLAKNRVTLNADKCAFKKSSEQVLGHIIDRQGVRADPEKTAAITKMEPPKSVTELHQFLGMVNQPGKFSPRVADITVPLRELQCSNKLDCGAHHSNMLLKTSKLSANSANIVSTI